MNKRLLCSLFLFLLVLSPIAGLLHFNPTDVVHAQDVSYPITPWVIDEITNTVYINDSDVFIAVSPATLHDSGWVYLNLTSKHFAGDIDVVFGFDIEAVKPKEIAVYHHQIVTTERSYVLPGMYLLPPYIVNYTAARVELPWIYDGAVHVYNTTHFITDFDFDRANVNTKTLYQSISSVSDWDSISNSFTHTAMGRFNCTDWWAGVFTIQAGKEYYARYWLDLPLNAYSDGKYIVAIKPHTFTYQQAIDSKVLYMLDPWWSSSWLYKKSMTITCWGGNASTDYAVRMKVHYGAGSDGSEMVGDQNWTSIYLNSHCRTDFGDVRFTDSTEATALSYYKYNVTTGNVADFYVKVSANLTAADATIYMYYGNAAVTTTSNGTATFLFFDDFESGTLNNWTTVGASWSINSTWVKDGVYSASATGNAGGNLQKAWTSARPVLLHTYFWSNVRTMYACLPYTAASDVISLVFNSATNPQWAYHQGSFVAWTAASAGTYTLNTWSEMEVGYSFGTSGNQTGWQNSTLMGHILHKAETAAWVSSWTSFGMDEGDAAGMYFVFDDYWARPWVNGTMEPLANSFGSEQSQSSPTYATPTWTTSEMGDLNLITAVWSMSDGSALSGYIGASNVTGTLTNATWTAFTADNTSKLIITNPSIINTVVQYQFFANSSSGNWNGTAILTNTTRMMVSTALAGYLQWSYNFQTRSFNDGTYRYFFYDNGSALVYRTTTNLTTFSIARNTSAQYTNYNDFGIAWNGSIVVMMVSYPSGNVAYRYGNVNSSGLITWLASWQYLVIVGTANYATLSLVFASDGTVWFWVYGSVPASSGFAYQGTLDIVTDTINVGTPYNVNPAVSFDTMFIIPLDNGDTYTLLSDHIHNRLEGWSGVYPGSYTLVVEMSYAWPSSAWAAVGEGSQVLLIYRNVTDSTWRSRQYDGSSWGNNQTVTSDTHTSGITPTLTLISNMSLSTYALWSSGNTVYRYFYNGTTWSGPVTVGTSIGTILSNTYVTCDTKMSNYTVAYMFETTGYWLDWQVLRFKQLNFNVTTGDSNRILDAYNPYAKIVLMNGTNNWNTTLYSSTANYTFLPTTEVTYYIEYQGLPVSNTTARSVTADVNVTILTNIYNATVYVGGTNGDPLAGATLSIVRSGTDIDGSYGLFNHPPSQPYNSTNSWYTWHQMANATYTVSGASPNTGGPNSTSIVVTNANKTGSFTLVFPVGGSLPQEPTGPTGPLETTPVIITWTVTDRYDNPLSGASLIIVDPATNTTVFQTVTGPNGTVNTELLPKQYTVTASYGTSSKTLSYTPTLSESKVVMLGYAALVPVLPPWAQEYGPYLAIAAVVALVGVPTVYSAQSARTKRRLSLGHVKQHKRSLH